MDDKQLGERVRVARDGKGWSQVELADHLRRNGSIEWTAGTVSAVENGQRSLKAVELLALLSTFDIDLEQFLGAPLPRHTIVQPEPIRVRATIGTAWIEGWAGRHRAYEAEAKAARALGVDIEMVRKRAQRLWGRRLAEEREMRANQREGWNQLDEAGQQRARGHVTRRLYEELKEVL